MNFAGKIVISLLVAAVAWAVLALVPVVPLPAVLVAATVITALLVSIRPAAAVAAPGRPLENSASVAENTPASGPRDEGEVKWFNVSKGFGFITKDDGEEIFVHFRSIRGEGRRGLREGQRVSFVETRTEKGPQAEDVDAL